MDKKCVEFPRDTGYVGLISRSGRASRERKWKPTPVFLLEKIPLKEEPGRLESKESKELDMTQ